MYIYDTRFGSYKTLPINGWFFPCLVCENITSDYTTKSYQNNEKIIFINIPLCNTCCIEELNLDPCFIKNINNK